MAEFDIWVKTNIAYKGVLTFFSVFKMSSIVSLSTIIDQFKEEISVFKKGEKSFDSGHVAKVIYDGSLGILKGEIFASMKNKKYSAEVNFGSNGDINLMSCDCPRGLYQCHHLAALLIYANKNISKTDNVCSWKAPTTTAETQEPVSEMYPAKEYNAINRPVNEQDKAFFASKLKSLNRFSGFYWLLQEEPTRKHVDWQTMQQILTLYNCKEDILLNIKVAREDILAIAQTTIGQRHNPLWHEMRLGRITASNFGIVIAAVQRNRFPPSLFSSLLGKKNLAGVKSIQWGVNHEEVAVKLFEEATQKKVSPTGLWLHTSGALGASPDGLVGDDAIVEVKCPFKHRMNTAEEIQQDVKYCFDAEGKLKINHPYYHQIQGQLSILDRSICYFIVWTTKETIILPVERDPNWELININMLLKFYEEQFINRLMS